MLTADELIKEISGTLAKSKVIKLTAILQKQQFSLPVLIGVTFHPDKNIAFRAAWLLENLFVQKPERYLNDLKYLLGRIKDVQHPACKRHYAKIVMHICSPKAPPDIQEQLAEIDLEPVVEHLFDWMSDPKVKVAVKVFAAQGLFDMRHRFSWIPEELKAQLQFLKRDGTAGIQSRGGKLLRQL